jgi:MFS family permease
MTDANAPAATPAYAWYVAALMMLTYAVQHIDRQIMAVILEPVKREFGLADTQLGLLSGLAFAAAYSLAVIPLGMLVDRGNRRNLLCIVLTLWSALTALGACVTSYTQLVFARLMVGAAESGGSPAAISLIADYFPPSRRSSATGLFFFGQGIGILAGFALGGAIAAVHGWRTAMLVAGLPGLALALLIWLTIREPQRRADTQAKAANVNAGLGEAVALLWRRRSLFWLVLGTLFGSAMVAAILIWIVSFLVRQHGVDLRTAGLAVGIGMGLSGAFGAAAGGFLADWFGRQRPENIPLQIALTQTACVAVFAFTFLTSNYLFAVAAGSFGLMLAHTRDGPVYAMCATLAGARRRGKVMALVLLLNNLVGYGLGPLLAGVLSDFYSHTVGASALQYALLTVVALGTLGILPFLFATRSLSADLARADE